MVAATGRDATGRPLGPDLFGSRWAAVSEIYEEVLRTGRPVLSRQILDHPRGFTVEAEVLHCPLARDGAVPDMIVGALSPTVQADAVPDGWGIRAASPGADVLWTTLDAGTAHAPPPPESGSGVAAAAAALRAVDGAPDRTLAAEIERRLAAGDVPVGFAGIYREVLEAVRLRIARTGGRG